MIDSQRENIEARAPFPLEGGRAGVGGEARDLGLRPARGGVERARRLRKESTVAERLLWAEIRKLKSNFRRQAPIGPYIADFAHHGSKLVIEIDGYHHTLPEQQARDAARTRWLNAKGYRVIRIDETNVRRDVAAVIARILAETVSPPTQTLPPSRGKGFPVHHPDSDLA
jgi:very-short-patch-repair endonuclease